jgi:hypothetical protein
MVTFRVSWFGRLVYLLVALLFACGAALMLFFLQGWRELPSWFLLGLAVIFVSCSYLSLYSLTQLFRLSARFEVWEDGFNYRGLFVRFFSPWSNVVAYRTIHVPTVLSFLHVRFANRPKPFGLYTSLDISGLSPDAQELLTWFRRHVRPTAK